MDFREDYGYESQLTMTNGTELKPLEDAVAYLREYTREKPEVVALVCFGVGFILGWKLKPW